jgi:tRNA (guanine6-N2)-methyltransferase
MAQIDPTREARLLDPFCGAGTILLEAGQLYPRLHLAGSDLHPEPVAGTRANAELYGLADRMDLRQGDARHLDEVFPDLRFDYVVTNPPYGLRMGQKIDIVQLYRHFLSTAGAVLKPEGSLIILVLKSVALRKAMKAAGGWYVATHRRLEMGGKYLTAFHLRSNQKQSD